MIKRKCFDTIVVTSQSGYIFHFDFHLQYIICSKYKLLIIHLILNSHEISFVHNSICQVILKFCTQHESIIAMLCAKLKKKKKHGSIITMLCAKFKKNDRANEKYVVGKWDFTIFEFKVRFRRISYIAAALDNINLKTT